MSQTHGGMVDYSKDIKKFRDNMVASAELELHNGIAVKTVCATFKFKDSRELLAAIAHRGKMLPLSLAERENLRAQLSARIRCFQDAGRVGKHLGFTANGVWNWVSGKSCPLPCMLTNISKALGCKRDELLEHVKATPQICQSVQAADPRHNETEIQTPSFMAEEASGLNIKMHVRATASGKYANYQFDRGTFRVEIAPRESWTPDELFEFGTEVQTAAVKMIG